MSFRALCFKCHKNYNSNNPLDDEGADLCPRCRKESKAIARMVDEAMAKRPKRVAPPRMQPFQRNSDATGKHVTEIYNARQLLLND